MATMDWLLIATGFTGALTLMHFLRVLYRSYHKDPTQSVHFSPKGGCTEAVVREIQHAHREILVQAYSFTSQPIAKALVDAKLRGVHVEILLDHSQETEPHTDLPFFVQQGLAPRIDAQHAIAHNKVMVIDGKTILTGSFNFTNQAEDHNAENLLVLHHHADLADVYRRNYMAHKEHSREPESKPAAQPKKDAKDARHAA
jgi:phosphatidylserine/phosphatidylglycerophosphate/cardiolipin synthase-like enzyme